MKTIYKLFILFDFLFFIEGCFTQTDDDNNNTSDDETKIEKICPIPLLPASGSSLDDFIPDKWYLLDSVELDFNEDKITDYVGVLEYDKNAENDTLYGLYPRILFAVASNDDGKYLLDFQDAGLIRSDIEGGMFDPYLPLTAEGKSFTTHTYGGSGWRWAEDFTYSYENGIWYLVYAEEFYGYGSYTTDYSAKDYLKGIGVYKKRSGRHDDMEKNITETNENREPGTQQEEDDFPFDLIYEISLDAPMTLQQASARWWLTPDRITDWSVESVEIKEGISINQNEIEYPDDCLYFDYCDENQAVYTFQTNDKTYLALYRYSDKKLCILAEATGFGINTTKIYQNKIYYAVEYTDKISYRSYIEGKEEIEEKEETTGIQLFRMNLDGNEKEKIFEYFIYPSEDGIYEKELPYLSLGIEINDGKIVVYVYIGNEKCPYYLMDLNGKNVQLLGTVPKN